MADNVLLVHIVVHLPLPHHHQKSLGMVIHPNHPVFRNRVHHWGLGLSVLKGKHFLD